MHSPMHEYIYLSNLRDISHFGNRLNLIKINAVIFHYFNPLCRINVILHFQLCFSHFALFNFFFLLTLQLQKLISN